MNWILIISVTSTMLAPGTSSSISTAVFKSQAACVAAGKAMSQAVDKNLWRQKVSFVCAAEGEQ